MRKKAVGITTLENWLWEATCSIRGSLDASKHKDYILPLLFHKWRCRDGSLCVLASLRLCVHIEWDSPKGPF